MGMPKLTDEEVKRRLGLRNLTLVGKWQGKEKRHHFACLKCDYDWVATGNGPVARSAKSKQTSGCPKCNTFPYFHKLTTAEVQARLMEQKGGITLVGEWQGSGQDNRFRCVLGHEWATQGRSVITENNGCPECDRLRQKNRYAFGL